MGPQEAESWSPDPVEEPTRSEERSPASTATWNSREVTWEAMCDSTESVYSWRSAPATTMPWKGVFFPSCVCAEKGRNRKNADTRWQQHAACSTHRMRGRRSGGDQLRSRAGRPGKDSNVCTSCKGGSGGRGRGGEAGLQHENTLLSGRIGSIGKGKSHQGGGCAEMDERTQKKRSTRTR